MTDTFDAKRIALTYLDACARHDLDTVARLLADDLQFTGPATTVTGAAPYLAILRRLSHAWVRSEVKKVFTDGNEVCVIYDFVTDTPAGSVPIVEWLRLEGGRIQSVRIYFDRLEFKPASDEIARRMKG